jgi:ATP-dependent DNA helicase RecQ
VGVARNARLARVAEALARDELGFRQLLEPQRRAIAAAAAGTDVLVVLPTGSGKSAIYQVTGEMRDGPTIVVSPLLALQYDQLVAIAHSRLSRAETLNSLIGGRKFRETLDGFRRGEVKFLFVAPEQLAKRDVVASLRSARPSLFVVDEAHCISMWGHEFRPDYLGLGDVVRALGRPPVIALTATAAPPVRAEIIDRLDLRHPLVVTDSFDRPEIDLGLQRLGHPAAKRDAVVSDVARRDGSGIVYVATRRHAGEVASALEDRGVAVAVYHGALTRTERARVHEQFLDESVRVVVATNAFGMGIDKHDVRFVFHHDVPGSLDAYYQEIGRAGRDRSEAQAILYFCENDLALQKFFGGGSLGAEVFEAILRSAHRTSFPLSPTRLAADAGISRSRATVAVDALVRSGAFRKDEQGRVIGAEIRDIEQSLDAAVVAEETRARVERSRLEMMQTYAETAWCLRALLLGYYGQELRPPCGNCDNCRAGLVAPSGPSPFSVGEPVVHREWGRGTVMIVEPERLIVFFGSSGYRTLSIPLVSEYRLLEPDSARRHGGQPSS